ncbi:MAG: hypothetical protein RR620_10430 [Clostridium sp.]
MENINIKIKISINDIGELRDAIGKIKSECPLGSTLTIEIEILF